MNGTPASPTRGPTWSQHLPELVLAGVPTILILLEIWVFDPGDEAVSRTFAGLAAGGSLYWIRRYPFTAYLTNGFALYALIALGSPSDFYQWTNLVALFAVAARVDTRKALLALVLGWFGVAFYFLRFPQEGGFILGGAVLAIWTAGWFAGRAQFARVRETELIRERDLSRAELAAQQARADLDAERSGIARDLHDIIGHAVNVMVVHAGAGQVNATPGSESRAVFDTIAATGRAALSDLDRMLDLLQGVPERSPLPGLLELDELCQTVQGPGLTVELALEGDPKRVPSSLGVATYRIVQEALTNVIKHARASRAFVRVRIADDLTIIVADDGIGGQAKPGRGLSGIGERAALHGGTVVHGPGEPRGFELRCRLPLVEVA
ncbi:MAG TPA: histidine kinase [Acidimicrobiia bacterium]|nr:histidine kinase [Acidimicrobiia bacterium]